MAKEEKFTINLNVNDLSVSAVFYKDNVESIFIPLLKKLTEIQRNKNQRILVLLAATPGAGKSTLASYLAELSKTLPFCEEIQSIGLDGFHYPNSYLKCHHINHDPNAPFLMTIKGAPQTFDVEYLLSHLSKIKSESITWPIYSRISHDVSPDVQVITKKIVLLEGNYLLLEKYPWNLIQSFADYTIFIKSDCETQKQHLINRKQAGGSSRKEAERHYEMSDLLNVNLVEASSSVPDLLLSSDNQMKYHIEKGIL